MTMSRGRKRNDDVEEEEEEDDDTEEGWSQDRAKRFVRACAVEMHLEMSHELLYAAEI